MGAKRGRGRGAFIDSVLDLVDTFYGDVVQHLKAWSAAPPRMREVDPEPSQPATLSSTALSSQDGAESAEDPATKTSAEESTSGNGHQASEQTPSNSQESFEPTQSYSHN